MGYAHSDTTTPAATGALPTAVKILIAGGFGAGKTTLVGSVSEIRPLSTEEHLTDLSAGVDALAGVEEKHTTTVAMDFGRITIRDDLILYLFGSPGQPRFKFVWDELVLGAMGAVVLADTRRLADCFPSLDYFERRDVPFIVAVNCFDDAPTQYQPHEVKLALNLDDHVPVLMCDARERVSAKHVLIRLVEQILHLRSSTRLE
jgi:uncharacterized protein